MEASCLEASSAAAGGWTPLGRELPFRRTKPSVGVPSVLLPPAVLPPTLFMLFIMSLTELFLEAAPADVVGCSCFFSFSCSAALLPTAVISPDFRSTPTMDQGRGLGSGLGLGTPPRGEGVSAEAEGEFELGDAAAAAAAGLELGVEDDAFVVVFVDEEPREEVNLVDRSPTMEPWGAAAAAAVVPSLLVLSSVVLAALLPLRLLTLENSVVGDVREPARPVDLYSVPSMDRKAKESKGGEKRKISG